MTVIPSFLPVKTRLLPNSTTNSMLVDIYKRQVSTPSPVDIYERQVLMLVDIYKRQVSMLALKKEKEELQEFSRFSE